MLEQLKEWDQQFLLFLNGFHADWLDPIILFITRTDAWTPLFIFLLYVVFKTYKKDGWYILAGVVITVLFADQITSGIMKPYFQRLRPSNEESLRGVIHLVNGYTGGLYGFASSHAANTTGVAFFFFLVFRERYRWIWLMFIWAFIMSYTRIYLGVHYPGDIVVGVLVGLFSGFCGHWFYRWLRSKIKKKSPDGGRQEI